MLRSEAMKKDLLRAACALALAAAPAAADVGCADPRARGARFDADRAASGVFCIRKPGPSAGGDCATAFLIHPDGYVLTAHHVEAPAERDHGAKLDWAPGPAAAQVLVDGAGNQYRLRLVKYPAASAAEKPFVKDPAKLMRLRFQSRMTGRPLDFDVLAEIDPQAYEQFDAVLLKVDDADLPLLKRRGAAPLPLACAAPAPGDRLFLAGYPWPHYPGGAFAPLKAAIVAAKPEAASIRDSDGGFCVLAGRAGPSQGITVTTLATPAQRAGQEPDTDAIDSFWGDSGGALLDADGRVVGVHWGSDNGALGTGAKAQITFATSIEAIRAAFALAEIGL